MMLVVDAGNSRLKSALADWDTRERKVRLHASMDVEIDKGDTVRTAGEMEEKFSRLDTPDRIVVASVCPPAVDAVIGQVCDTLWSKSPLFLESPSHGWGVTNAYRQPHTMGVDRFAAMVAAHHVYQGPKLVVDCGSAVTADVLDGQGRHLGGVILPGTYLMRRALFSGTARIPAMEVDEPTVLGQSTAVAVASGTILAVAGALRLVLEEATARLGQEPTTVVTGGGAPTIASRLGRHELPDFNLVLYGVAMMGGLGE